MFSNLIKKICLFIHISFDYEGIPLKEMKKLKKFQSNLKKDHKISKMFQFVVSF